MPIEFDPCLCFFITLAPVGNLVLQKVWSLHKLVCFSSVDLNLYE